MSERGFPLFPAFSYRLCAGGRDEPPIDEDRARFRCRVVRGSEEGLDELYAGRAFVDPGSEEDGWVEEVTFDEDSAELEVW